MRKMISFVNFARIASICVGFHLGTLHSYFFHYRYMYLKTYAKFTFCIKSQGHVSDENFLYYCIHLAGKISSYGV